ncbi:MAG: hypothetical protein J0M12_01035 [Deltaproteobacteria bacterium]|nr:hypothetical protein [Deltaproteobacteria bacterium]
MRIAIQLPFRRRRRPELSTPNDPTFNATLLIIGIAVLALVGVFLINYIGFAPTPPL